MFMFITDFTVSFMIKAVSAIMIDTHDIITHFTIKFKTDFMIFTAELADDFMLIFTLICETEFIN